MVENFISNGIIAAQPLIRSCVSDQIAISHSHWLSKFCSGFEKNWSWVVEVWVPGVYKSRMDTLICLLQISLGAPFTIGTNPGWDSPDVDRLSSFGVNEFFLWKRPMLLLFVQPDNGWQFFSATSFCLFQIVCATKLPCRGSDLVVPFIVSPFWIQNGLQLPLVMICSPLVMIVIWRTKSLWGLLRIHRAPG